MRETSRGTDSPLSPALHMSVCQSGSRAHAARPFLAPCQATENRAGDQLLNAVYRDQRPFCSAEPESGGKGSP